MSTKLKQKQSLRQSLSPQQLIQANILQLNVSYLEKKILDELEKNPLLEQSEPEEISLVDSKQTDEQVDFDEDPDEYEPSNIYDNNNSHSYDFPIKQQVDFIEDLVQQLDAYKFKDWERAIAEEILWNLDDNGYLPIEPILIADRFQKTSSDVIKILEKVQQLDPPGIAARDLQDCLKIQLSHNKNSFAYKIVTEHFDDFSNHRYENIQKKLNIGNESLSEILQEISKLDPHPRKSKIGEESETVVPDLLILRQDENWKIIVNDSWIPELSLNDKYVNIMDQKKISTDEKKYLKEKFNSASWFISAIKQRRKTLFLVMKEIIIRQPKFFEGDTKSLIPMKLKDIAEELNMDISTISRSTRGKYVDTPYGIFELKSFFTDGYIIKSGEEVSTTIIKNLLKQLIDDEDKKSPLTDSHLAEKLNIKGYPVARRTVAKYREQLEFPVARLRRQLTH